MNCKYMAKLASLVFTNRYFEFVQSDDFINLDVVARTTNATNPATQEETKNPRNESSKLLSAFDQLRDRTKYGNKAYNSDKFRELQPRELSSGRRSDKLIFEPRNLAYWEEYFG